VKIQPQWVVTAGKQINKQRICGRNRRRGETTILKWILNKYGVKMLTAFNYHGMGEPVAE
jgi:hypothetical protein